MVGKGCLSAAWLLLLVASVGPARAQDEPAAREEASPVTLTARAGPLSVRGALLAYDGDVYRIGTAYGPLTLAAAEVACEGSGCPIEPAIAIEGDGALADVLMPALIEAYAIRRGRALTPGATGPGRDAYLVEDGAERLRIVVSTTTSDAGLAALDDSRANVALTSRAAEGGAGEPAASIHEGGRRILALDALVPVVSPRSPLRTLDLEGLTALLSGNEADWSMADRPPEPLTLHLPEVGAAADGMPGARAPDRTPGVRVVRHPDPKDVSRAVMRDPGALGLTTADAVGLAEPLALRGRCGLVSRFDPDAVRSGDWPLALPLRLHLPARPLPRLAREIVEFASSPEAQGVVRRAGLIDQDPTPIPLSAQGDRLAAAILRAGDEVPLATLQDMTRVLSAMTRLSPTFRFERGVLLDASSRDALTRLARRIAAGEHDGQDLVLVGFGDGTGSAPRNLVLSRRRAEAVLEALRARIGPEREGGPKLSAAGYGEALPVSCDDTPAGRRLNRRVELWTR